MGRGRGLALAAVVAPLVSLAPLAPLALLVAALSLTQGCASRSSSGPATSGPSPEDALEPVWQRAATAGDALLPLLPDRKSVV